MSQVENAKRKKPLLLLKTIALAVIGVVFCGLLLFVSAGTLQFRNAWLFLVLFLISFLTIYIVAALKSPKLVESRLRTREKERRQQLVMFFLNFLALSMLVVAGLDRRWSWSFVPIPAVCVASILIVAGFIIQFLATRQNSYASGIIEIQKDQELICSGLYSVVRHPMYLSFIVISVPLPILLGSWFSLTPACCTVVPIVLRIKNEERMLLKELAGYDEYVKKVRYRLIPLIW